MRIELDYQEVSQIVEVAIQQRFGGTWQVDAAYALPSSVRLVAVQKQTEEEKQEENKRFDEVFAKDGHF